MKKVRRREKIRVCLVFQDIHSISTNVTQPNLLEFPKSYCILYTTAPHIRYILDGWIQHHLCITYVQQTRATSPKTESDPSAYK